MKRSIDRTVRLGQVLRDLGEGLVLRCAKPEDTEELVEFQRLGHFGKDNPVDSIAVSTRDLMNGDLPNFAPQDWTVVEDSKSRAIVSALCLISQTWSYDGIHFPLGRVELVVTDPDYRRRGLVRSQMEVVHQWSRQRGELVLGITGIPWYYRQFGYETALEQDGGRHGHPDAVPRLTNSQTEPFRLRSAIRTDIPLLVRLYQQGMRRYLVSCVRDEELWRYELTVRSSSGSHYHEIQIIESPERTPVGILVHRASADARTKVYELEESISFEQVTPSVLRYLRDFGKSHVRTLEEDNASSRVVLELGATHPAYEAACEVLPVTIPCYAWYVHVPALPEFLRQITPVLEQRLASSTWAGYTGVFHINFVHSGIRFSLEKGRMTKVENWLPPQFDNRYVPKIRDALFPGFTFLQLLFGYRAVEELEYAFPDCLISSDEARDMLNVLFPVRSTYLWAVQ